MFHALLIKRFPMNMTKWVQRTFLYFSVWCICYKKVIFQASKLIQVLELSTAAEWNSTYDLMSWNLLLIYLDLQTLLKTERERKKD